MPAEEEAVEASPGDLSFRRGWTVGKGLGVAGILWLLTKRLFERLGVGREEVEDLFIELEGVCGDTFADFSSR